MAYSITGQASWKNIEDWRSGLGFAPTKKLTVNIDFRELWLANVHDSLYNIYGTKEVTNAKATSSHVGEEIGPVFGYSFNSKTKMGLGLGYLDPGSYLIQSKKTSGYLLPYLSLQREL
jgi:alginate export protein